MLNFNPITGLPRTLYIVPLGDVTERKSVNTMKIRRIRITGSHSLPYITCTKSSASTNMQERRGNDTTESNLTIRQYDNCKRDLFFAIIDKEGSATLITTEVIFLPIRFE